MSGHNKWSKIKHKKAATDAVKSKVFSKHAALIAMESRKAGGDTSAPGLIAAIERAKKDSMPKDNIDRAVAKGGGAGGAALEEVTFEAFGPGGTALIITAVTDNNNRTAPEIKHIFSKAGYELGAPGSSLWAFTKTSERYVPNMPIELSDNDGEKLAELIEKLEEQDDVQEIYTTADTPEGD
ncbi:YebC/PmpR family DNA-binding transcriptional regulator [Candidatus Parcubacteria bacterium]|uniref:YebC/PmpR family DNA-binding transcriptional regulator n=1 Tax=Candidatus Kaiserbacteria bacterium CG10_big_fil_rev_8_21_14_0_10_47_16 TaxID=1974608 RepID=A0A2H0UFP9_9BACT|nr:YebC/PmpR family DNA-binding transcriptional regulator [Candidatus Parcubacteria bacterium]PIR84625.1 MAG: YebC/PmpR family DNA-binding transcriptional regulator [Candidatus Kaiserbacteria bacterium CG10_big_fil_rev_8_21_14_0_10_47_16]